jgi:hypothetical protein
MGWNRGSDIFDPVARQLIACGADRHTKFTVLGTLLDKLLDEDWDTADESLEEFRHDRDIVALFTTRCIAGKLDDGVGDLDYDVRRDLWVLTCDLHGRLDSGNGSSAEEHDRLVRVWVRHCADLHGGTGRLDADTWRMLIDSTGVRIGEEVAS